MFKLIEGDGFIENIYHLLWMKDTLYEINPFIMIPQTIIYKYSKPCYWYFTSKIDSTLKKKSNLLLNNDKIKEEFLKNYDPNIDVVAYYVFQKFETKDCKPKGLEINYLSKEKFLKCLESKMPFEDGMLQKFEHPKGDKNFTLILNWTPKMCLLEKKVNLKALNDNRYSVYERVVTIEGEEFHTGTQPIRGTNLPDRLEKIANSIVNHISSVSMEMIKISRMILNFKINKYDNILLLWCSSLRLEKNSNYHGGKSISQKPFDVEQMKISVPDHINMFQYSFKGKALDIHKNFMCPNCDKYYEEKRMCKILFKNLIEAHANRKRDKIFFNDLRNSNYTSSGVEIIPYNENKSDKVKIISKNNVRNLLVPKVINELFPKLKYDQYEKIKDDEVFYSKIALLCEECFILTTKYCNIAGTNTENVIRMLKNKALPNINMNKTVKKSFKNN